MIPLTPGSRLNTHGLIVPQSFPCHRLRGSMLRRSRTEVLLILPSLNGGGAERVAITLMRHCDPDRFDMRLALLQRTGPYLADVDPALILSPAIGETWLRLDGPN